MKCITDKIKDRGSWTTIINRLDLDGEILETWKIKEPRLASMGHTARLDWGDNNSSKIQLLFDIPQSATVDIVYKEKKTK
jgi:hypothetical protein